MKKNGFTLAEVLITLTIIGVIATITLPALITNTQEQQARTAFKKGISTLTDISQMNQAIDGFDYAGITSDNFGDPDIVNNRSLYAMLANRGSIDFQKSASKLPDAEGFGSLADFPGGTPTAVVYFRDGTSLLYLPGSTDVDDTNGVRATDGLPVGFTVVFDTNGPKGPNILSNCTGAPAGAVDEETRFAQATDGDDGADADDITVACTENNGANRVIRDRFLVQLRGGTATPYGAAAQWAFDK